jgi:hypothetical protein
MLRALLLAEVGKHVVSFGWENADSGAVCGVCDDHEVYGFGPFNERGHSPDCPLDAALVDAGYRDNSSRIEARAAIRALAKEDA